MSSLTVRAYRDSDFESWDRLVQRSWNGTFLHTRKFLSYHGNRFNDASLVIEGRYGEIVAVFPAAIDPQDQTHVVSHPGITYGGIVHAGDVRGSEMMATLGLIANYYSGVGYSSLAYKAVPYIYHKVPSDDDLYALFRASALRVRSDLASVIDLQNRPPLNRRRKRSINKATANGVRLQVGHDGLGHFWPILTELLHRKFGVKPVHSLEEIELLVSRFPDQIDCVVAYALDRPIAGAVYFHETMVLHAQYSAANEIGYDTAALDLIFEHCISTAVERGNRFFSFGICTEKNGLFLNDSLYQFKNEFGAGGVTHEFYRLDLGG